MGLSDSAICRLAKWLAEMATAFWQELPTTLMIFFPDPVKEDEAEFERILQGNEPRSLVPPF